MRTPIKHRPASHSITPSGGPLGDNVYRVMIFDGEAYQPSQVIQLNITLAEPPQIGDTITMEWAHSTYFAAPEMTFRVLGILREARPDTSAVLPILPAIILNYPCLICGVIQ